MQLVRTKTTKKIELPQSRSFAPAKKMTKFTSKGWFFINHLLNDIVKHRSGERVISPDPQSLVERLDGLDEVAFEGVDKADGRVGGGWHGLQDEGLLVEGQGHVVLAQLSQSVTEVVKERLPLAGEDATLDLFDLLYGAKEKTFGLSIAVKEN